MTIIIIKCNMTPVNKRDNVSFLHEHYFQQLCTRRVATMDEKRANESIIDAFAAKCSVEVDVFWEKCGSPKTRTAMQDSAGRENKLSENSTPELLTLVNPWRNYSGSEFKSCARFVLRASKLLDISKYNLLPSGETTPWPRFLPLTIRDKNYSNPKRILFQPRGHQGTASSQCNLTRVVCDDVRFSSLTVFTATTVETQRTINPVVIFSNYYYLGTFLRSWFSEDRANSSRVPRLI